jgi:hypothetical protein
MSNNDHKPRLPAANTNAGVPTKNGPNSFPVVKLGPDGYVEYKNRDNSNNNDLDHSTTVTSDGGFESKNFDSSPERNSLDVSLSPGSVREYSNNKSSTKNANDDNNVGKNSKTGVGEECGREVKTNDVKAVGKIEAKIINGDTVDVTPKSSQNNKQKVTSGNDNEKVTGSKNFSVEGDYFHSTGESRYDVVKNGDYAVHVQNGTLDVLSKKTVRITGDERVILTCGSSYILMLPNRIEIVADRVDINPSTKTIDVENLSGST